jgi:hypothetical protein
MGFKHKILKTISFYLLPCVRCQHIDQKDRIGDVWIHVSPISPNQFSRFFIPRMEDLFWTRDQILKVENSGAKSRLIS